MKQSAFQDHLNVAINDGTHRLTIRWTPKASLHHSQRPQEWTKAALTMLKALTRRGKWSRLPLGKSETLQRGKPWTTCKKVN